MTTAALRGLPCRALRVGGCVEATLDGPAGGVQRLHAREPLGWYPERLTDMLEQWAQRSPDQTFVAQRDEGGAWVRVGYAQMLARARAVGQALLDAGVTVERPLAVLSGNDLAHATLLMAAMWAGVPCVSVSVGYSLASHDFAKLRHVFATTTPGMVYAAHDGFAPAIAAVAGDDVAVVLGRGAVAGRPVRRFDDLCATRPGPALDAAHAATGPETIVKFLFTSGSTRSPKAVITTQRMLCANQQMLRQCLAFVADEPPVLVDWLPWSHTFGGNHNLGLALYNGGTLYIDEGKPTPAGLAQTLHNLREISPTLHFNVPKGLEEIANAMDHDVALRDALFRRLKLFMFAGAGLSQAVWDKLDAHGMAACGERVRIVTSLGMTETAPACLFDVGPDARSGCVGLPCPGVEVKLVPMAGKTEIRFRGPNVMPGYWRDAAQTAAAFDDEGYYRTGDAVRFVDPHDLSRGLMFDGRLAEDFKLSSGTFVSVGPLRARVVAEGHPCVQDAVLTGADRDDLGVIVFPRLSDCRSLAGLGTEAGAAEVLHHPAVRAFFQALADRLHALGTGGASRVARLHVAVEPPSAEHGEITDKNSLNQRAVLAHRASLVDAMHEGPQADPWLILAAAVAPPLSSKESSC